MGMRITAIVLAFLLAACVRSEPRWMRTELYFGCRLPDGREITAADWQLFASERLALLPGYTEIADRGRQTHHP
jgi:hypothetical protein